MEGKQVQIVQNFLAKCVHLIADARASEEESSSTQSSSSPSSSSPSSESRNRWFNLELIEHTEIASQLEPWMHVVPGAPIPPLVVEVVLDPSPLRPGQSLALQGQRCDSTHEIVLERFVIECCPLSAAEEAALAGVQTHTIYKHAVVALRVLYTALRLLPAFTLAQRLRRQKLIAVPLRLGVRVRQGDKQPPQPQPPQLDARNNCVPLSRAAAPGQPPPSLQHLGLQPVLTRLGALQCGVTYRQDVAFAVEDSESALSHKFMDIDINASASQARAASSSPLSRPVLSFTRPFKSNAGGGAAGGAAGNAAGSVAGSTAGSTAGSASNIAIPQQPQQQQHHHQQPQASSASSASSRFSSSFAPRATAPPVAGSSSSSADLAEVNEFLRFLEDTRRSSGMLSAQPPADLDAQLQRFQMRRQQAVQLSDSVLETVRQDRRVSGSRSRLYEDDDEMLFALGD